MAFSYKISLIALLYPLHQLNSTKTFAIIPCGVEKEAPFRPFPRLIKKKIVEF